MLFITKTKLVLDTIHLYLSKILKKNFFKRLITGIFLVAIFYGIRTGDILYVQILFFIVFFSMLWELNKSFNIPISLIILAKAAILIEIYSNLEGATPNIFLYISFFRFLLISKHRGRFFIIFSIFLLLATLLFNVWYTVICLLLLLWDRFNKNSRKYLFSFFVVNYVCYGFLCLYNIFKPNGLGVIFTGPVIMMLACAVNDIFAYICGSLIGGPKLSRISKRKTISGLLGGIIFTYIVGYFVSRKLDMEFSLFKSSELFPIPLFFLPFLATIGDLFQSYIKRYFKKKDAGMLLPGHGGIFDRLDSMFFVAVIYACTANITLKFL